MDAVETNGLPFRSGMLQSWNKLCFSSGYVEVSLSLPGPNDDTQGYVSCLFPVLSFYYGSSFWTVHRCGFF